MAALILFAAMGIVASVVPWRFRIWARVAWPHIDASFFVWGVRVVHLELPPTRPVSRLARRERRREGGAWPGDRLRERLLGRIMDRRRWGRRRLGRLLAAGRYLFGHLHVRELAWHTQLGITDAAAGALAAGALETVQTWVSIIASHARPSRPLHVTVNYGCRETVLRTELNCIFTLAPAHAIIAGVRGVVAILAR